MLEHVPEWLGHAIRDVRAGGDKLCIAQPELGARFGALTLSSPAFGNGARIPSRFTADGKGVSPPLLWDAAPAGTRSLALIVEDADSPSPQPLVHGIVWNLDPDERSLTEGAITADGAEDVGRNSYFQSGWLPPDPPTGHGSHSYAFQLFALAEAPQFDAPPGRSALVEAMQGNVVAAGLLIATYSRGEGGIAAGGLTAASPA